MKQIIIALLLFTLTLFANIPPQITCNDQHQPLVVEYEDGSVVVYTYDEAGNITRIETPTRTIEYSYDAHDHRIAKVVNGNTTTYLIDPNTPYAQVIRESKENGTEVYYTYGKDLLSDGSHTFLGDALGSTRALADGSGRITDSYDYTPYGELRNHSGTTDTPFLFTGEQFDPEAGLYYLRARYYSPELSRFLSRDTYEGTLTDPITQNPYAYANDNPLRYVDPSGHFSMMELSYSMAISGILNATINAGLNYASGEAITVHSLISDFAIGMLEGGVFIGSQKNIIRLFDRFSRITKITGLTKSQAKRIDKINEIAHNLYVRNSLSGDLLDAGHIEKLRNHKRGLEKSVNALSNSLNNPNLNWRVRRLIRKKINEVQSLIRKTDELLQ